MKKVKNISVKNIWQNKFYILYTINNVLDGVQKMFSLLNNQNQKQNVNETVIISHKHTQIELEKTNNNEQQSILLQNCIQQRIETETVIIGHKQSPNLSKTIQNNIKKYQIPTIITEYNGIESKSVDAISMVCSLYNSYRIS